MLVTIIYPVKKVDYQYTIPGSENHMKTDSANVEPKIYDLRNPKKSKLYLETDKDKGDK